MLRINPSTELTLDLVVVSGTYELSILFLRRSLSLLFLLLFIWERWDSWGNWLDVSRSFAFFSHLSKSNIDASCLVFFKRFFQKKTKLDFLDENDTFSPEFIVDIDYFFRFFLVFSRLPLLLIAHQIDSANRLFSSDFQSDITEKIEMSMQIGRNI